MRAEWLRTESSSQWAKKKGRNDSFETNSDSLELAAIHLKPTAIRLN
jgi:hypothetical protein